MAVRVPILVAISALVLTGCSSLVENGLSRKYAEAARSLGVNPVYPPREEFQVGDVFLVSTAANDPDSAVSVWLGTLDTLRVEADKFLKSRVVFKDTGVASNTSDTAKSSLSQEDLFSPDISTRNDERVVSLPIAAFPSITVQAGQTASTGLVGALAALGFGTTEQTSVTLDFNDVRTYWVPQVIAANYQPDALVKFGTDKLDLGAAELPQKIAAKQLMDGRKWSGQRCLSMAIVTRVYLTRKIQYTYRDRQIVAAGIKFATESGKLSQVAAPPAITVNVLQSGGDETKNGETAAAVAEALRQSTVPTGSGAQGGSFSFVSWSARGLTFEQTYQRPVAVGWEGFQFNVDPGGIPDHRNCHVPERH
jgi:hypothetical protein